MTITQKKHLIFKYPAKYGLASAFLSVLNGTYIKNDDILSERTYMMTQDLEFS